MRVMNRNIKIVDIYFLILMCSPIIDSINGAISQDGSGLSSIYRMLLLLIAGLFLIKNRNAKREFTNSIVIIFVLFLLTVLQWIFLHQNLVDFKLDIYSLSRIIFPITIFLITIENKSHSMTTMKVFSLLFPICIVIPYFLKIGTFSYENGAGYKGYFIAANDISIVFLCLLIYSYANLLDSCTGNVKPKEIIFWLICTFANLISLMVISTKTGIVFSIIFTIIFLLVLIFKIKNHKLTIYILMIVGIIALLLVKFFSSPIVQAYNRAVYFYAEYQGNFLKFITSSRSELLKNTIVTIQNSPQKNLITAIGEGFTYDPSQNQMIRHVIEMDIFDIFTAYGVIGGITFSIYYGSYFFKAFLKKDKKMLRYKLMLLMLIEYSFTAGHVFYTALGGSILGLVLGQLYELVEVNDDDIISN